MVGGSEWSEASSLPAATLHYYSHPLLHPSPVYAPFPYQPEALVSSSTSPSRTSPTPSSTASDRGSKRKGSKEPDEGAKKARRVAATERERNRSQKINSGFDRLRTVLPEVYQGRKLSKHETLMLAQVYINQLTEILQENKQQ